MQQRGVTLVALLAAFVAVAPPTTSAPRRDYAASKGDSRWGRVDEPAAGAALTAGAEVGGASAAAWAPELADAGEADGAPSSKLRRKLLSLHGLLPRLKGSLQRGDTRARRVAELLASVECVRPGMRACLLLWGGLMDYSSGCVGYTTRNPRVQLCAM